MVAPWWWWEARPFDYVTERRHHAHHRHHPLVCWPRLSLLATVRTCGICAAVVCWRGRWDCCLSQQFGADGCDLCWRDRRRDHFDCGADRFHDVSRVPYPLSDRSTICSAGCCCGISCCLRAFVHCCTSRNLARGHGCRRRNDRGGGGIGAFGILRPVRRRAGRCCWFCV